MKPLLEQLHNLPVRCHRGHVWDVDYDNLVHGTWCSRCAGRMPSHERIEEAKRFVRSKGGQVLYCDGGTVKSRLKVKCQEGHVWEPTFDALLGAKKWCRKCADKQNAQYLKHPDREYDPAVQIEKARRIVEERDGAILEATYESALSRLTIRCDREHIYTPTFTDLFSGRWCLQCYRERAQPTNPLLRKLRQLALRIPEQDRLLTRSTLRAWRRFICDEDDLIHLLWDEYRHDEQATLLSIIESVVDSLPGAAIGMDSGRYAASLVGLVSERLTEVIGDDYTIEARKRSTQAIANPVYLDIEQALKWRQEGRTYTWISQTTGVSRTELCRQLKDHPDNVTPPNGSWHEGRPSRHRKVDPDEAKRLRDEGLSYEAIGRRFGATKQAAMHAVDDEHYRAYRQATNTKEAMRLAQRRLRERRRNGQ